MIFCSLTALQQIVSTDINERDRIYGSEIWPSLSDLFNNVSLLPFVHFSSPTIPRSSFHQPFSSIPY